LAAFQNAIPAFLFRFSTKIHFYKSIKGLFEGRLLTGARRQDLAEMRYTNINIDDDGSYIELPNLKSNRI